MSNIPTYITAAISKANGVDKSHAGHHLALMKMMAAVAKLDIVNALETLQLYVDDRTEFSPDSLCTKSTFMWLEESFGLFVNKDGKVQRGKEFASRGFTKSSFERARNNPWYELVKSMAFKVPAPINLKTIAVQALKRAHMGDAMPDAAELYAMFTESVEEARGGKALAKWIGEYDTRKEAGELDDVAA